MVQDLYNIKFIFYTHKLTLDLFIFYLFFTSVAESVGRYSSGWCRKKRR